MFPRILRELSTLWESFDESHNDKVSEGKLQSSTIRPASTIRVYALLTQISSPVQLTIYMANSNNLTRNS